MKASLEQKTVTKQKKVLTFRQMDNVWGYAFVLIPIVGMVCFVLIPLIMSIYASFTSWPVGQSIFNAKWVGLRNYTDMFKEPLFWKSLENTLFCMLGIPIGLVLSLLLALAMNSDVPFVKTFRVIYYIPVIASLVAVSFIFQRFFMNDGGVVNTFLQAIGIQNPPNWLATPGYTKWVIVTLMVWKGLGGSIILYIAGMQGISPAYYEAAKIDGSGAINTFFKITLPLLAPITFFLIVTSIIGGAQLYVEPRLIFEKNGPMNSTVTTVMYLFDHTFVYSKAGYGSAVSIVLGIIVFAVTALQFYINGKEERDEKKKAHS